jgi:quercetin dioxygenase-like cupin family protein
VRLDTRECSNNGEKIMKRILLAAAVGAAIGVGGLALAQHGYRGPEKLRTLSERDIIETLNGQKARVTTQEVTFEPGQAGLPHRHAGPIFGYVLEGEFEFGLGEEPPKTLKAGATFYEPSGVVHRAARNPSTKTKTRVLAVILHPRDVKEITTPAD